MAKSLVFFTPEDVEAVVGEKATIHLVPPGTSIREKLHSDVKYLGTNFCTWLLVDAADEVELCPNKFPIIDVAVDTKLEVLFFEESSAEKTWMVP